MATKSGLTLLKKEIRILGLSSRPIGDYETLFVGVVFRGSLWLDAVFSCILDTKQRDFLAKLSRAIRNCHQYPQLHALVLREDLFARPSQMIPRLSRKIGLPILAMTQKPSKRAANRRISAGGRSISVRPVGTDRDRAREIFVVGSGTSRRFPEALRVAELITKPNLRRIRIWKNPG